MKPDEIYDSWRQNKRHIDVRMDFCDQVMSRIRAVERERAARVFGVEKLAALVSLHPMARAALVAAGAFAGVLRLALMINVIFNSGVTNG
jgi:hypothetical protein